MKIFNWIATTWRGNLHFDTAMLCALGFIAVFTIGGPVRDLRRRVPVRLAGARHLLRRRALPLRALRRRGLRAASRRSSTGGRRSSGGCSTSGSGKLAFWLVFVGFNVTFLPQHLLGLLGMHAARSTPTPDESLWNAYNLISSIGSYVMGARHPALPRERLITTRRGRRRRQRPVARRTRSSGTRPRRRRRTTSTRSRT